MHSGMHRGDGGGDADINYCEEIFSWKNHVIFWDVLDNCSSKSWRKVYILSLFLNPSSLQLKQLE